MLETPVIFHGSQFIIEKPAFGEGNPRNDYGLGFYCTHEIELAKEWACNEESSGFANRYEMDMSGLSITDLSGSDYNILNWLSILLDNRVFRISNDVAAEGRKYLLDTFKPDVSVFDVIKGYRADDSYFAFAGAFLNNTLSLERLENAMYLGNLGEQIVLKSRKSFEQIHFLGYETADHEIFFPMRRARDKKARLAFRDERGRQSAADSVFLVDILRERWENDDPRIRRNISG